MKKIWMLLVLAVLCFIACDMPGTGGNPDEGRCDYVLKEHADEMKFDVGFDCPYESSCKLRYLVLYPINVSDDIYCGRYQYKLVKDDREGFVELNTSILMNIDPDDHLRFSLFDNNDVEKKYDFDLSGIIHSYTVRGDSVDVNLMENCRMVLYPCEKEIVYGSQLADGLYSFSKTDGCDKEYGYSCKWSGLGPNKTDDLDISAKISWRK